MFSLVTIFKEPTPDVIIPSNAIRFRVIANSDSIQDQNKKLLIKEDIENKVYDLISDAKNVDEVRNLIEKNMNDIEKVVESYNIPYDISYGNNYFPTKNYKGVLYKAGNYESLVITLGKGMGSNFWCVLFPPLCLLDSKSSDVSDVEYQLYVKKLFDKF